MIKVGGLTPFTTIDFPGQHSAVIFCQGCPWKCHYCHNTHLMGLDSSGEWSWNRVLNFLSKRRDLLDAVVFSGGEPLLQEDLLKAIQEVKNLGFKIGLHTGGFNSERFKRVLPLLDWVGFDIKAPWSSYESITQVPLSGEQPLLSLRALLASGVSFETRTTVDPRLTSEADLQTIQRYLLDLGVTSWLKQEAR